MLRLARQAVDCGFIAAVTRSTNNAYGTLSPRDNSSENQLFHRPTHTKTPQSALVAIRFRICNDSICHRVHCQASLALATVFVSGKPEAHAQESSEQEDEQKESDGEEEYKIPTRSDLPFISREDVALHCTADDLYVTYQDGVYDVTEWLETHPGGSARLMLAAGTSIDSYWAIYGQHQTPEVREILEMYRIGNTDAPEIQTQIDSDSPFANDPQRHPGLVVRNPAPFNAETPPAILSDDYITDNSLFYVRNHLPVPLIEEEQYQLVVTGESIETHVFSYDDLRTQFPKHTVTATVQCAGNRRNDLNDVKKVKGGEWSVGAISTATWSGARLKDVLASVSDQIAYPEYQHVWFEGLDTDNVTNYGASIPLHKAIDEYGDVILAYEMNGETLPRDHGYPVRALVPGVIGARSVKWLGKIHLSKDESTSHWQRRDYRSFSPNVDWDNVDFSTAPSMQEFPVQSAITHPSPNETISARDGEFTVKGYSWSGGGREIIRVDVTTDNGETWTTATLVDRDEDSEKRFSENPSQRDWAWRLWEVDLPIKEGDTGKPMVVQARAWDSAYNTQPERSETIWNLRGIISNAWHGVTVNIVDE